MKVKIFPGKGQTQTDAEEQLEKAVLTKRAKREEAYAKESYNNDHLDQLHDHIVSEHKKVLDQILNDVRFIVRERLGK